jgi:phosphatidylglycerol lysyltransferase
MAVIIVFAGIVLLFSGTLPATHHQHLLLQSYLPLWVVEFSHIVASVTWLGLIILAHGLLRQIDTAYRVTAILLSIGIVASYLKGLDYDEAIMLAIILTALLPTRRGFHRQASLFNQGLTVEWIPTLMAILAVMVWLGLFSYKNIEYSPELWWSFGYDGDYSRFLRSTFVVFALTGGATLVNFFWLDPEPELPHATELKRVHQIIKNDPETRGNLALLGDKRLFFSDSGNAFIMYQVQGKSWVALGDPVGPSNERPKLLWRFRELCDQYGGWPVFYLIDTEALSLYTDLELSLVKLGDEARVGLGDFTLLNVANSEVRAVHRDIRAQGVQLEIVMSTQVPALLPELKAVSNAWLEHTHTGIGLLHRVF